MTVYLQADQISCSKEKHVNHNTLYDKRKLSPKWYTNSEDIFLYEHICTVSTGLILKHWDVYAASWNGKLYSFIFWSYHSFNLITVFPEQNTICIFCQLNLWIISLKFAFVMHEKSWRKKRISTRQLQSPVCVKSDAGNDWRGTCTSRVCNQPRWGFLGYSLTVPLDSKR